MLINAEHGTRRLWPPSRRSLLISLPFLVVLGLFVAHAWMYAFLCDDAFISFRYARNLIAGHGLVFNVGERVEGYTNLLWVLQVASAWGVLKVQPQTAALVLSWGYSFGALALTTLIALRTRLASHRWLVAWLALLYLAIDRTFAVWTTGGLETRSFTFFVLLAAYLLLFHEGSLRRLAGASVAFGAAELTRPEASMLFALACAYFVVDGIARAGLKPKALAAMILPGATLIVAHFAWRYFYYGQVFPNTYYAKAIRPSPEAGLVYWTMVILENGLYVSVPLAMIAVVWNLVRRNWVVALPVAWLASHAAYIATLGGDLFEYRPLDFYWPLLAVPLAEGMVLVGRAIGQLVERWRASLAPVAFAVGVVFTAGVTFAYETVLQVAKRSQLHSIRSYRGLQVKITRESSPFVFLVPGMRSLVPVYNDAEAFAAPHCIAIPQEEHRLFVLRQLEAFESCGASVGRGIIPPTAVQAYPWVGVLPFYMPDLTVIDIHGLTDAVISHATNLPENADRCMGHERLPPPGYLASRGENIEVKGCAGDAARALKLGEYAVPLDEHTWLGFDSRKRAWALASFGSKLLSRRAIPRRVVKDLTDYRAWAYEGEAMTGQPVSGAVGAQHGISGVEGPILNSFHPRTGDVARGRATSPSFVAGAGQYLSFRVGGGRERVGVRLMDGPTELGRWSAPENKETLDEVMVSLSAFAGRHLQVVVFDESGDTWGHVEADHFAIVEGSVASAK